MSDNSLIGNTTGVNTPEKIMKIIKAQTCATCIKSGYCYDFRHGIIQGDGCDGWEDRDKKEEPRILDSGNRTEFATGAVRDMREGKGRMDLMPLEVVAELLDTNIISDISQFKKHGNTDALYDALIHFTHLAYEDHTTTMLLEVGKHFEEGAKKYGENNWQKGIEPKYYIDSAIRHYLKWRRGDKDEPHDRAFVWNIMCCIWETDFHEKEEKEEKEKYQSDEDDKCIVCKHLYKSRIEEPCVNCMRNYCDLFEHNKEE